MNPTRPSPPPNDVSLSAGLAGSSLSGDATAANLPSGPPGLEFLAPPQQADEIGRLGTYRILGTLGAGGMGMVFRAEDPSLRRAIALKVMLPQVASNPMAKARFLREARSQAKVEHDNIIPIHHVGEDRGVPFLAMPLLKGQTLSAALKQNPLPPLAEVLRIGREMAEGLGAAHEMNLVHRDIKPANVWLEGNKRRVKILDFGLARFETDAELSSTSEPVTRDGAVVGTPAYMSPEQARGEPVDARTDLFSLGIVLYQMATGEMPFKGATTMAILMSLGVDTPAHPSVKNPAIPQTVGDLITRLLAKPMNERPASAEAVAEEIQRIENGSHYGAAPVMTAVPVENDPWADIDASDTGVQGSVGERGRVSAPSSTQHDPRSLGAPTRPPSPGGRWVLIAAGVLIVLGVVGYFAFRGPRPESEERPAAPTTSSTSRPSSTPATFTPREIDLLAYCDPARDAKTGLWTREGTTLRSSGKGHFYAPYEPPIDYNFLVDVTRLSGSQAIGLYVPHPEGRSSFFLAWGNIGFGFDNDRQNRPGLLKTGQRYSVRVEVRGKHLRGFLNDELIGERLTGPSLPKYRQVGFLCYEEILIHRAVVREISGPGKILRENSPSSGTPDPAFFNGKDLTGWVGDTDSWTVENGELVWRRANGGLHQLGTLNQYSEFTITCQVLIKNKAGFSVPIFIRSRNTLDGPGNGGMKGPAIRLHGNQEWGGLIGRASGEDVPIPEAAKHAVKLDDYNDVTIRCVGTKVTTHVNGVLASEGEITPLTGSVGFGVTGSPQEIRIRNLRLTDMSKPAAPPSGDWVPLFNGTDLTGWEPNAAWKVADGALTCESPAKYLYSTRSDFGDFHLRAEVKCADAANGGIYFRSGRSLATTSDYEAQIAGPKNSDSQKTGSLYRLVSVSKNLVPADTWFTYEIIARGPRIRLLVNGEETADYTESRPNRNATGRFVLQSLTPAGGVAFRKIEIQETPPSP